MSARVLERFRIRACERHPPQVSHADPKSTPYFSLLKKGGIGPLLRVPRNALVSSRSVSCSFMCAFVPSLRVKIFRSVTERVLPYYVLKVRVLLVGRFRVLRAPRTSSVGDLVASTREIWAGEVMYRCLQAALIWVLQGSLVICCSGYLKATWLDI